MASVDLRDAYLHSPISLQSQKYLKLAVKMEGIIHHLQFKNLPFWLSSSPRIFTKMMSEALALLRLQGIAVISYLDDLLFFAPSRERLQDNLGQSTQPSGISSLLGDMIISDFRC